VHLYAQAIGNEVLKFYAIICTCKYAVSYDLRPQDENETETKTS